MKKQLLHIALILFLVLVSWNFYAKNINKDNFYPLSPNSKSLNILDLDKGRFTNELNPKEYRNKINETFACTIVRTSPPGSDNQEVCEGDAIDPIIYTIVGTSTVSVTGAPIGININITGPTLTINGTPDAGQVGDFNLTISLSGGSCVGGEEANATIRINQTTVIDTQPSGSGTYCPGDAPFSDISVSASGTNLSYQWYVTDDVANPGNTAPGTSDQETYTPPVNVPGTFYYYVIVSGDCGNETSDPTGPFVVKETTVIDTQPSGSGTYCPGDAPFSDISVSASGTNLSYQWYVTDDVANPGSTAPGTSDQETYTPPVNVPGTFYYYVIVSGDCGNETSDPTGPFVVHPEPLPTFTSSPASTSCAETDITYTTEANQTDYDWDLNAIEGTDYIIISGGISNTDNSVTVQWLTEGDKTVTVGYTDPNTGCNSLTPASNTTYVNLLATVSATSIEYPTVCYNPSSQQSLTFTQTTTGVSSIGAPNGLPDGFSVNFSAGVITITGTPTSPTIGAQSYSIPLFGTCINGLEATGTIDITPQYEITSISSISASYENGPASVTILGDPNILTNGTYIVTYDLSIGNNGSGTDTLTISNGTGTFSTIGIQNPDLTQLSLTSIKKITDTCTVSLDPNSLQNITYFGICSTVFTGDGTFFVPANVYEITIKVWAGGGKGGNSVNGNGGGGGGGGGYSEITVPVTPGEPLGVFVGRGGTSSSPNGGNSWVTRDSNLPYNSGSILYAEGGTSGGIGTPGIGGYGNVEYGEDGEDNWGNSGQNGGDGGNGGNSNGTGGEGAETSSNNSTIGTSPGGGGGGSRGNNNSGAAGGNGIVLISFSCPDANQEDCMEIIDEGSASGVTIIRFNCNYTWNAPEGLAEFFVWAGGAGGGGGAGSAGGGGGSGGVNTGTFTSSSAYGYPAGTPFTVLVGQGGAGSGTSTQSGLNGSPSSVTGPSNGSGYSILAPGGGGGASSGASDLNGKNGGSGGGGAALRNGNNYSEGVGGAGSHGGIGGAGEALSQGQQQAISGGGGGGLDNAGVDIDGNPNGNGTAFGGDGGNAVRFTIENLHTFDFGAGGGGLGTNFNGNEFPGLGGMDIDENTLGGNSNPYQYDEKKNKNEDPDPPGQNFGGNGRDGTGSGGGAGFDGGGNGGRGVVYIYYFNLRILEVEYLYFEASYLESDQKGLLKWATSKEWENSHFEIERSINGVANWQKIGTVKGQGYSNESVEYQFKDENLPASGGIIYYRLKQFDFDGKFAYSKVKSIQVEPISGNSYWVAYPNPSNRNEPVSLSLLNTSVYNDEPIVIRISDAKGVTETYTVRSTEEVSEKVNYHLRDIDHGLFIIQLIWGNHQQQIKLIRK